MENLLYLADDGTDFTRRQVVVFTGEDGHGDGQVADDAAEVIEQVGGQVERNLPDVEALLCA